MGVFDTIKEMYNSGGRPLTFTVSNLVFDLKYDTTGSEVSFVGRYTKKDGDPATLDLKTFIASLGSGLSASVPTGIGIALKSIKLIYNSGQFAIALDIDNVISLSNLPIIGSKLPAELSLNVEHLQIIYCSGTFSEDQLVSINELLPENVVPFDSDGIGKGMSITADFTILGQTLKLNTGGDDDGDDDADSDDNTAVDKPGVFWFDINKTIGPVNFRRIGTAFNNNILSIFPDASLDVGGLSFALTDLEVSTPINNFSPSVDMSGIAIDFNSEGIEIGGSFLKMVVGGVTQYNGTAVIKTEGFAISALGSYSTVANAPSLFIYAYLDKALGGPSFFYVEGLALGFGYNRSLIMPTIDKVASFPLVAQVMGGDDPAKGTTDKVLALQKQLDGLAKYIPPTAGGMFLAVGVKFNSFRLVDSFALLSVSFGQRVEVNILGQSNMVVPSAKAGVEVSEPLAEIKIMLLGKYLPEEGFLGVVAQLTNDSYIFSRDCHLSGGAAFYSWFKGVHEGDFVVTMGGYHPSFSVPSHYPKVPRLALSWDITDDLSIKGDMYFALCPHAFMAGGHLEAVYEVGDFKAWFKAGADFLITWQPYHYEARIYVDIGASYEIDCYFGSVTLYYNIGADVSIWGPEFSGTATVYVYVGDVTISFGEGSSDIAQPIPWSDFSQTCLPDSKSVTEMAVIGGVYGQTKVIKKGTTTKIAAPLVNPKDLSLTIDSVVPLKVIKVNNNDTLATKFSTGFGIAPMDKNNDTVISTLNIGIEYAAVDGTYNSLDNYSDYLVVNLTSKMVPAALWDVKFPSGKELSSKLNRNDRMMEVHSGLTISSKLVKPSSQFVKFPDKVESIAIGVSLERPKSFESVIYAKEDNATVAQKALAGSLGIKI